MPSVYCGYFVKTSFNFETAALYAIMEEEPRSG